MPSKTADTQRDRHLQMIKERGQLGRQQTVNYGRRSLGEVTMWGYKTLIGQSLRARTLRTQKSEATIGCKVINIMTDLAKSVSRRAARTRAGTRKLRLHADFCTSVPRVPPSRCLCDSRRYAL